MYEKEIHANQLAWNEWAGLHVGSKFYDVEGFKTGKCSLLSIERGEIGDVSGKSLLHLQCHFGMDTLSWARLGARVTGVDFSVKAIEIARSLSRETGISGEFIQSNIYELPQKLAGEFDIVFTSYGVLCWLPDLPAWARVAAHFLRPGGVFYIVEEHPASLIYEMDSESHELQIAHSYFHTREGERYEESGSYAEPDAPTVHNLKYEWKHCLGDVVNAVIGAGLTIEFLHEFPYSFYPFFPVMEKDKDGWWKIPGSKYEIPFIFSLMAHKPCE